LTNAALTSPHASLNRGGFLMYDLAAIAIGAACFALIFAFLYLLERI
jgi:hypothetical protein